MAVIRRRARGAAPAPARGAVVAAHTEGSLQCPTNRSLALPNPHRLKQGTVLLPAHLGPSVAAVHAVDAIETATARRRRRRARVSSFPTAHPKAAPRWRRRRRPLSASRRSVIRDPRRPTMPRRARPRRPLRRSAAAAAAEAVAAAAVAPVAVAAAVVEAVVVSASPAAP